MSHTIFGISPPTADLPYTGCSCLLVAAVQLWGDLLVSRADLLSEVSQPGGMGGTM
jgi:hypothetical protein